MVPIDELNPLGRETRHPKSRIDKLAANLPEFGFVVDAARRALVAAAARQIGLRQMPVARTI